MGSQDEIYEDNYGFQGGKNLPTDDRADIDAIATFKNFNLSRLKTFTFELLKSLT